jgi:hypothetical protein
MPAKTSASVAEIYVGKIHPEYFWNTQVHRQIPGRTPRGWLLAWHCNRSVIKNVLHSHFNAYRTAQSNALNACKNAHTA